MLQLSARPVLTMIFHGFFVEHRKHSRLAGAHRADVFVRRYPEFRGTSAKYFCICFKLGVDLEPYYGFEIHLFPSPSYHGLIGVSRKDFPDRWIPAKKLPE